MTQKIKTSDYTAEELAKPASFGHIVGLKSEINEIQSDQKEGFSSMNLKTDEILLSMKDVATRDYVKRKIEENNVILKQDNDKKIDDLTNDIKKTTVERWMQVVSYVVLAILSVLAATALVLYRDGMIGK